MFLKLKIDASGYPEWIKTTGDEDKIVQIFQNKEGILLDKAVVGPIPAKRALAKLTLNSLWEELGGRNNRAQSRMISDPLDLYRFLVTTGFEVMNLKFAGDECVWVSWKYSEAEEVPSLKHTNEVVAAFDTAVARIHLYKYLNMLKDKVLYCDKDNLIYVEKVSEAPLVQTGQCLGEITYEKQAGQYISEFVPGGPKNYAYTVCVSHNNEAVKTVCKVRGITLNYSTSKVVNFDVLKDMVMKREPGSHVMVHTEI